MSNAHIHVSFLSFMIWVAYYIVAKFFWSFFSAKWAETPTGQAMLFLG